MFIILYIIIYLDINFEPNSQCSFVMFKSRGTSAVEKLIKFIGMIISTQSAVCMTTAVS